MIRRYIRFILPLTSIEIVTYRSFSSPWKPYRQNALCSHVLKFWRSTFSLKGMFSSSRNETMASAQTPRCIFSSSSSCYVYVEWFGMAADKWMNAFQVGVRWKRKGWIWKNYIGSQRCSIEIDRRVIALKSDPDRRMRRFRTRMSSGREGESTRNITFSHRIDATEVFCVGVKLL